MGFCWFTHGAAVNCQREKERCILFMFTQMQRWHEKSPRQLAAPVLFLSLIVLALACSVQEAVCLDGGW